MQYRIRNGDTVLATVDDKKYTVDKLTPNTKYTFSVTAVDGEKESKPTEVDVTTRGIRVTIPVAITDETVTLDYQEYSLGLVPIGTEPKGMFGGGNKETLLAKVVSAGDDESTAKDNDKTDTTTDEKTDSGSDQTASNETDENSESGSDSQTNTTSDGGSADEVSDKTVVEITSDFDKMKDNLTMKQLDDGSFAVFEDYKALYFNGKKDVESSETNTTNEEEGEANG